MTDIEDFGLIDNISSEKYKYSYEDKDKLLLMEEFVLKYTDITEWSKLENKIRDFSRINHFQISKIDLIYIYQKLKLDKPDFYKIIVKRSMRSESGVLVVTVVTSANPEYTDKNTGIKKKQRFSCSKNCYFCPSEPAHKDNNWIAPPRSYLTQEPAILRSNKCGFDCVKQFRTRVNTYMHCGHSINKIETIVLGGTISSYPKEYVEEFCRDIYYASNTIYDNREERYSLEEEIKINETAKVGIIGLTLETRPDCITFDELKWFRKMGVTRIQIGVQHTSNEILKKINRGHTIECAKKAIKLLKDFGFKIDIHLMPLLPGSTPDTDRIMLNESLENPDLSVDQLKIYPCSIVPWTKIEKWYNEGTYIPYSDKELFDVIAEFKQKVHPWIRLNRIIRDINTPYIIAGCKTSHMRQLLQVYFKKNNLSCKCIRCREIKGNSINKNDIKLTTYKYPASDGIEYFISYTSKDEKTIYGFLRLRIPSNSIDVIDEVKDCALLRELHVYGKLQIVGSKNNKEATQHFGFGKKLLKQAEYISRKHGYYKISCISGIGVREYYKKNGYKLNINEMQKELINYNKIIKKCIICIILITLILWFKLY
jgi:ELP3 family radical SAM enzyme/protein acetyltransferase